MSERYGVVTKIGTTVWFFTIDEAMKHASEGNTIIRGVLHNDEGCSPYIEKIDVYETPKSLSSIREERLFKLKSPAPFIGHAHY